MTSSTVLSLHEEGESLSHYSSKYYDPVKAHEYYERTKKLKGSISESPQSDSQSSQISEVASRNKTARDAALTSADKAHEAKVTDIQLKATQARDKIVEKLMARVEELRAQAERVELNPISRTANTKLKSFLDLQNTRIKNKAAAKANQETAKAAEEANAEILKIGTDLKETVARARESYAASRKAMVERYKKDLTQEVTDIRNNAK